MVTVVKGGVGGHSDGAPGEDPAVEKDRKDLRLQHHHQSRHSVLGHSPPWIVRYPCFWSVVAFRDKFIASRVLFNNVHYK